MANSGTRVNQEHCFRNRLGLPVVISTNGNLWRASFGLPLFYFFAILMPLNHRNSKRTIL
jgi:hypothetical protein